ALLRRRSVRGRGPADLPGRGGAGAAAGRRGRRTARVVGAAPGGVERRRAADRGGGRRTAGLDHVAGERTGRAARDCRLGRTAEGFVSHDLKALIEKLGPVPRRGLETAAALCVAQTHYNVEVEHLLVKLLDLPSDLDPVLRYYEGDKRTLASQLEQALE